MVKGVFGWVVGFGKACGLWKTCCGKTAVGKAENRLVRAAVSFVPSAVAEEHVKFLASYLEAYNHGLFWFT
jgi:hypothetical protein